MKRVSWVPAFAVAAALAGLTGAAAQEPSPVSLQLLLGRAAWYVDDFMQRFANVVAEENYFQDSTVSLPAVTPAGRGGVLSSGFLLGQQRHRVLKSDFLLVQVQGAFDWLPFRDVFEVDGVPVRDREERLTKLFLKPSDDALAQADRIRDESARYNLGSMKRTVNNPILPLAVLQADAQQRFRYTLGKPDPSAGPDVWIVDFKEEAVPTMIRGRPGFDLFARGRLWIELETGRLVKSDMYLDQPALRAEVITSYRFDERFGITVPAQMDERYTLENGAQVSATATYGRFRRFGVTTDEQIHDDRLTDDRVKQ